MKLYICMWMWMLTVDSHQTWMLRIKHRYSAKAVSTIKHWETSPASPPSNICSTGNYAQGLLRLGRKKKKKKRFWHLYRASLRDPAWQSSELKDSIKWLLHLTSPLMTTFQWHFKLTPQEQKYFWNPKSSLFPLTVLRGTMMYIS